MSYFSIDITKPNQQIDLTKGNYYRSTNMQQNIKKCYEVTIKSLFSNGLEIGFTNEPFERYFCSYYGNFGKSVFLRRKEGDTTQDLSKIAREGDTLMVCIDSNNLQFKIVIDNEEQSFPFEKLSESTFWGVYLDSFGTETDKITLNLGQTPFLNRIPEGFSSWFEKIFSCKHKTKINLVVFVYVIIIYNNQNKKINQK